MSIGAGFDEFLVNSLKIFTYPYCFHYKNYIHYKYEYIDRGGVTLYSSLFIIIIAILLFTISNKHSLADVFLLSRISLLGFGGFVLAENIVNFH